MASQVKVNLARSQTQRLSKRVSLTNGVAKESPKPAVSNSRPPGLRTSSRLCASKLPVPLLNKADKTKRKTSSDRKDTSSSTSDIPHNGKKKEPFSSNAKQPAPSAKAGLAGDRVTGVNGDHNVDAASPHGSAMITIFPDPKNSSLEENQKQNNSETTVADRPTDSPGNVASLEGPTIAGDKPVEEVEFLPGANLPPSSADDPWHLAYTELRATGKRMAKLDNIERDVASLKGQLNEIAGKTTALEGIVRSHSTEVNELKSSLAEIKSDTERHDTEVENLWQFFAGGCF